MKLMFITDARFIQTPDGDVYSIESSFSYNLYLRYMQYFSDVVIVARVKQGKMSEVNPDNHITKKGVSILPLPYYVGLNQYMKTKFKLAKVIKTQILTHWSKDVAVICRIPGRIGTSAIKVLQTRHIPYGIEVVGDPYDVLSKNVFKHPFRPILQLVSSHTLKRLCKQSPASLYVTKVALQKRYPCPNYSMGVSDVVMPEEAYVNHPKQVHVDYIHLISVGSLALKHKAPDIVMDALILLKKRGIHFHFVWVGDGVLKQEMINYCNKSGIIENVRFVGKLTCPTDVRDQLDQADIFLMPSRMEGLPRALVEAMARALPCICTPVGGIPELLSPDALIPVNESIALANKIISFMENKDFYMKQSTRNLHESRNYSDIILEPQRREFYEYVISLY